MLVYLDKFGIMLLCKDLPILIPIIQMRAFSFCLYGPPGYKYYTGLLENLELISKHYPEWIVFVYTGADVPETFIETLISKSVRVIRVPKTGPVLMMYRFLTIDQPGVDLMLVRDADSRIHMRDRWAIDEFVSSKFMAHSVRDHPYHGVPLLGGLWGVKLGKIANGISQYITPFTDKPWAHGKDQDFLRSHIFPLLKDSLLVHTSQVFRFSKEETIIKFPLEWTDAMYCGKVVTN